jgi:hypothetical protein
VVLLVVALTAPLACARTITLTDEEAQQAANIWAGAPRQSWAAFEAGPGLFINYRVDIRKDSGFLLQMPIDKIPPGNRITKAELVLPLEYTYANDGKLFVWRIIPEWGAGVCYEYRTTLPKPVKWAEPGARGSSTDRATVPTVVATLRNNAEIVVNVTADVEMWYTGAAKNHGWLFTLEGDSLARFLPPAQPYRGGWKLRITYEPR